MSRSDEQSEVHPGARQWRDGIGANGQFMPDEDSADTRVAELPQVRRGHEAEPARRDAPLLDAVLDITATDEADRRDRIDAFLSTRIDSPKQATIAFLQWCRLTGEDPRRLTARQRSEFITCAIGEIDRLLNDQVNAILHHEKFQRLEASWRGLQWLVEEVAPEQKEKVKIRALNVTWKELNTDLVVKAIEFDQSNLFKKVYEEEFGTPNGEPFGALIGDYQITSSPEDIETLQEISHVAAAAFAPFIAAADPSLLNLDHFADLDRPRDLARHFSQPQFAPWRSFREQEDARFVGLTLPRVLMRRPYELENAAASVGPRPRFCFREHAAGPDRRGYLWGNAAYAFGEMLLRAFQHSGWLADIRGVRRNELGGGIVPSPANRRAGHIGVPETSRRLAGSAEQWTEVIITDDLEHELADLGFMPLCHCQDTGDAAFYTVPSTQLPRQYDDDEAMANARISAMLQHVLCASRFAHYLKIIIRDKIGSYASAESIQYALNRWISDYVRDDDDAAMDVKARYPLRRGDVQVQANPRDPSKYFCEMHLKPHYQLDALAATVRLTTDLTEAKR